MPRVAQSCRACGFGLHSCEFGYTRAFTATVGIFGFTRLARRTIPRAATEID